MEIIGDTPLRVDALDGRPRVLPEELHSERGVTVRKHQNGFCIEQEKSVAIAT
jgi:hypothetical protein